MAKRTQKSESQERLIPVGDELAGQTLAAAIRKRAPKLSWSQVRQFIEGRRVMIDGNLCVDAGRRLKGGEAVKLLAQPAPAAPREDDVKIVYLDDHVVVVEKPAGMTTNRHREEIGWPNRRKQIQPTLDELVPHVIAKLEGRRGRRGVPPPVRAVHRLDRETSGLIVFARVHSAERALAEQFRRHTTHRRYLAIVAGKVEPRTIESRLVRDRGDGRRGSTTEPGVGKRAVTHVKPVEFVAGRFTPGNSEKAERAGMPEGADGYTLIQCRLETGRTHQIRIHLSEAGHPVCGDRLYRQAKFQSPHPDASGASRLALHAVELGFAHPATGKVLRFQSPLPGELASLWLRLRAEAPKR